MVLPQYYPQAPTTAVASYDYTDIAEGTGVTLFYAFVSEDNSAKDRHLTADAGVRSRDVDVNGGTADGAFTLKADYDFDLSSFNLPKTIKGTAILTFPFGSSGSGSSNKEAHVYIIAKIRKWDGTTETDIASAQTNTIDSSENQDANLSITIPQTHFKKGETLRLTIEVWAKMVAGTGGTLLSVTWQLGHDPANRDGSYFASATNPTQMILRMPFKLDI